MANKSAKDRWRAAVPRRAMRNDTRLRRQFLAFHNKHRWVYEKIVELCKRMRRKRDHYSMRTVIASVRYEWDLDFDETVIIDGGEEIAVKLNNNHAPYYARLLAYHHPEFRSFFNFRRVEGEVEGEVVLFSDNLSQPDLPLGG